MSNCINSGLRKIYILPQHKALSVNRHVRDTWHILPPELGEFIEVLPPTRRVRNTWYLGTADAVYQNTESIEEEDVPFVLILSADHVYKMNYQHMLDWHVQHGADVTVATTQVPSQEASRFGIVAMDPEFSITGFEEKLRTAIQNVRASIPDAVARRWAYTCSPRRSCWRPYAATRRIQTPATISGEIFFRR